VFSIRIVTFGRFLGLLLAMALAGALISGCGSESRGGDGESATTARSDSTIKPKSEYHQVLLDFHAAAIAGRLYDAYGFGEHFPPTQRAAVHAFCFVADRMVEHLEAERLADNAYLIARITRKAEADMKLERDVVAPARAQRAIRKLNVTLELASLDQDLAERFVRACY
jgi:hypothetical protein